MSTSVLQIVRASKKEQCAESAMWLGVTLAGSLFPLWGSFIVLKLVSSDSITLGNFVENGEFALYTASFVVPALYLLSKERSLAFPERPALTVFGSLLLLVSALIFGGVTVLAEGSTTSGLILDRVFLQCSSVVLLTVASLFIVVTHHLDVLATDPDIRGIIKGAQKKLEDDFDALETHDA